jgi:sphingolipid delta-4 desaturase
MGDLRTRDDSPAGTDGSTHNYFDRFVKLGYKLSHLEDEEWEYSEEPHVERRQLILQKYPQIKKLMGYEPRIAMWVTLEVLLQLLLCYLIKDQSWTVVLVMAYVVGGTINHSLGAAIHEIGHNLAFGHSRPLANRFLGIFANLPMGIPISVTYKKYHSLHHRYLGHDTADVDVPSWIETVLFRYRPLRVVWLIIHPAIHGIRPFAKFPTAIWKMEIINTVVQLTFDVAIYYAFGEKAVAYFVGGTLMALGLHPTAGHFISEHYLFNHGQATYSYYGSMNYFTYNLGYHVEHHDFPYVPYSRLPEVRRIAAEFYDNIPYHTSWIRVLWDFITKPDMGPAARGIGYIKRDGDGKSTLKNGPAKKEE